MLLHGIWAHYFGWPRLYVRLVEHQALAVSTGVSGAGHLRLPLGAPSASRPAPSFTDWASIAFDCAIILRDWAATSSVSFSTLCTSASWVSAISLNHPIVPAAVRAGSLLGLFYGERSFLQDLSKWVVRACASVLRILRYGCIDMPGVLNKARRW